MQSKAKAKAKQSRAEQSKAKANQSKAKQTARQSSKFVRGAFANKSTGGCLILCSVENDDKMFMDVPKSDPRSWVAFVEEKSWVTFANVWGPQRGSLAWVTLWVTLGKYSVGHFIYIDQRNRNRSNI